jgi:aminotransferase
MEDVISLGVGEPDYATPWVACEAGIHSVEQGRTSYTSNKGVLELRQEISRYLAETFGLAYTVDKEIVVTTGASEAIDISLRAVVDPGDEVLVPDPSFVAYTAGVLLACGVPVHVPCTEKDEFRLTADALMDRITPRTKALICNFPSNPTGAVMSRKDYQEIADVVIDHDLVLISDEIYTELTYEGEKTAAASVDGLWDRTITINGFSKAYSMTGWRIGYLCAPQELCDTILKIHQYVMMSAPTMSQIAATEALRSASQARDEMVTEYLMRRNMFIRGLNRIGLPCHMPKGAFYAFPSIASTGLSDNEFAEILLKEHHVAVVPGSAFGPSGTGHIRCAYAVSRGDLKTALMRMEEFIGEIG